MGPPGDVLCVIRVVNGKARCETHNVDLANDGEVQAHRAEKLEEWRAQQQFLEALKGTADVKVTEDLSKIKDPVELAKRALEWMQAQAARKPPRWQGNVEISFAWGDKLALMVKGDTLAEIMAQVKEIRDTFYTWTRSS